MVVEKKNQHRAMRTASTAAFIAVLTTIRMRRRVGSKFFVDLTFSEIQWSGEQGGNWTTSGYCTVVLEVAEVDLCRQSWCR